MTSKQKANARRLSIYERSLQQKLKKEQKLSQLRSLTLKECTFTPETVKTNTSNRTTSTRGSNTSAETVFQRLYRHSNASSNATPVVNNLSNRLSLSSSNGNSSSGRSSRSYQRIEELYFNGVCKARARPRNGREEKKLRESRREECELAECTFRPQLNWGPQMTDRCDERYQRRHSTRYRLEPKINPRVHSSLRALGVTGQTKRRKVRPPSEIIVEEGFGTPRRGIVRAPWDCALVSPLREPSVGSYEDLFDVSGNGLSSQDTNSNGDYGSF